MFAVPVHFLPAIRGAGTWLLMVIVVSLVASAWPATRATRTRAAVALSYE